MLPPGDIQGFERLIDKVHDVANLYVSAVSRSGEQDVGQLRRPRTSTSGGDDAALSALVVSNLDELAEPPLNES